MKALIIGVGGQDGSYLVDILSAKGYEVHGLYRRSSVDNLYRVNRQNVWLHEGDLTDATSLFRILKEVQPDEIYNVADQDHVGFSHYTPAYSIGVTAGGVANLLESMRCVCPAARLFQPCSATMFGPAAAPQDETTPFSPKSPYAIAKVAAYHLCQYYREKYDLFISVGIMYNHESPRRGGNYLLQESVRKCHAAKTDPSVRLSLSNLHVKVDIGHAHEYMVAANRMLLHHKPDDFCIATGDSFSIRYLAQKAVQHANVSESIVVEVPATQVPVELTSKCVKARSELGFSTRFNAYTMLNNLFSEMF